MRDGATLQYTATLRETHPVDVEVPQGTERSVQGAVRLAPRQPAVVTEGEAKAIAASGFACDLEPIAPAQQVAIPPMVAPSAPATPATGAVQAGLAEAGPTGDGMSEPAHGVAKPARKRPAHP